jgi:hypothetical protein
MAEYGWLKDTFKVVSTIYSSNWNSISSGFHYATHLVWGARVASPAVQGIVATRDIWLWPFGCTCTIIYKYSVHVPVQV